MFTILESFVDPPAQLVTGDASVTFDRNGERADDAPRRYLSLPTMAAITGLKREAGASPEARIGNSALTTWGDR
jgi:hypothetical protein